MSFRRLILDALLAFVGLLAVMLALVSAGSILT